MRMGIVVALVGFAGGWAAGGQATVRVAAVQCYSRMGESDYNRKLLTRLIEKAAEQKAKIVVLPECAVQGYMDPGRDKTWSSRPRGEGHLLVRELAESVPGPSTNYFGQVAQKHGIYLVVPLIEASDARYYNVQVLLNPEGRILLHHRKWNLWPPGDATWATAGERPIQVAATPYGRLGLMICYDVHRLSQELKKGEADIVLYSVGWYGPNTDAWFGDVFPRRYVVPNGFAVVAANWSADEDAPGWPGHGYSCIIDREGKVLAMAKATRGEEIVVADLPIHPRPEGPEFRAARRYPPNTAPVEAGNEFARANPGFKRRAGQSYEKEYLGKATEQLTEWAALSAEQVPAARAILCAYIYDYLDAKVRAGGEVPVDQRKKILSAMDERFQGELSDEQCKRYLQWRRDRGGAHNALAFLMRE